jgi:hypothetical protein
MNKYYPQLFESPDVLQYQGKDYNLSGNAYPFEVIYDEDVKDIVDVIISSKPGMVHSNIPLYVSAEEHKKVFNVKRNIKKIYPGRLFMDPKVITFWNYPSPKELKHIIKIISKKNKLDFSDWKIEIYPDVPIGKRSLSYAYEDRDENEQLLPSQVIPIGEYEQSMNPPEEEYQRHIDQPIIGKKPVKSGYGSKNPKYQSNRAWDMANLQHESFCPTLVNETVDTIETTSKSLHKKLVGTIIDEGKKKVNIYSINDTYLKQIGFIEFVEGGHHYVDLTSSKKAWQKYAKFIPENEIWIDELHKIKPEDFKGILRHENTERNLMKYHNYSYDKAHDIANKAEIKLRKKIINKPSNPNITVKTTTTKK